MKVRGFGTLIKSASVAGVAFLTGVPTPALPETVAEFEARSVVKYRVIGLRDVDGSPLVGDPFAPERRFSTDQVFSTKASVTDRDGNEVNRFGILEYKSSDESTFGRLISEEYNVYLKSYFEALWYNRFYSDAEEPIWATLSFDYDLSAAASSNSALASAYSRASDRALGPDGTAVVSDEDAAELSLFRSVSASSGGPVSSAISGSYVFDVLFRPGDYAEFNHFFAVEGGLESTTAPIPLPLGAPLLVGSLAILVAASRRRG